MRDRLGSDLLSAFAIGGGSAFIIRVLGAAATLALYLLLVDVLGETGYGHYIYALNWVTVLSMVTGLGLDTAALRFVPSYTTLRNMSLLKGYILGAPRMVAGASIAAAALVGVTVALLRGLIAPELLHTFWAACLVLPLMALVQLVSSMIRGQQRVLASVVPQALLRPLSLMVLIGIGASLGASLNAPLAMLLDGVARVGILLLSILLLSRRLPAAWTDTAPRANTGPWLGAALPLMAVTSMRFAMSRTDILMLGLLVDTTASGIYALASQMTSFISFPLMAGNVILAPLISERHAARDDVQLQRLVTFATRSVTLAATVLAVGLMAVAPWALGLFGPSFEAAYWPLVVLALAQLVNAAAGAVGFLLSMTGHERVTARTTFLAALLNLTLNAILIPWFGLVGAAIATGVSGLLWNILLVHSARRLLGIRSTILG